MKEYHKKESPVLSLLGMGGGGTGTALGGASADPIYVDDVFSTFLYEGNNTTGRDIVNNIDLAGEGGLVWVKKRNGTENHVLIDTVRGANKFLRSDLDNGETTTGGPVTDFNSNGFEIDNNGYVNASSDDYVSWTFRKCPGFIDIVTYTGNGTAGREIAHSLGSTPGMVIVKRRNTTEDWTVYHRSLWTNKVIDLNKNAASHSSGDVFDSTAPTSTVFTVGSSARVNANGSTYVAYIFAHDDQSFGTDSDEAIIKCGTYTGNGTSQVINLGFEAQWVLIKNYDDTGNWAMYDVMRGMSMNRSRSLSPNGDASFSDSADAYVGPSRDGFLAKGSSDPNYNGDGYIYMAIRRPHKPITTGTEFFETLTYNGTSSARTVSTTINPDAIIVTRRGGGNQFVYDRIRGSYYYVRLDGSQAENPQSTAITTMGNNFLDMGGGSTVNDSGGGGMLLHLFRRAPEVFDIVTYTGTGSAGLTVAHNLGVVPEMIWVKKRTETSGGDPFEIYHSAQGATKYGIFDSNPFYTSTSRWNDTTPTATQFTLGSDDNVNTNTHEYFAYLFATLDGVTKVGSYSGTGSAQNIDCGFSSGARFVMIKRTDTETYGTHPDKTEWYVWDSVRGIGSGNEPFIYYSDSTAEITGTDYIDPLNAGFTVSSTGGGLNASGGTYIFYAIA